MGSFITTAYKGRERSTDGADLVVMLVTAAQTPTRAMTVVSDITAEVTGADYARADGFFGGVEVSGDTVLLDWVDGDGDPVPDPLFQVDDVAQIAGAWTALAPAGWSTDDDLELVAYTELAGGPVAGTADWPAERGDGYARVVDADNDTSASAGAPTTFIYNSSGAQTGNRYNDEGALWAAVAAAPFGAKDIIVEQNETFTTPTIDLNGGGFLGVNTRILLTFDGSVSQITNPGNFLVRNAVFLYNASTTESVLKVDGSHANSVILEDSCAILAAGVSGDGPGFIEITEASGAAGIGLNNAHLYKPSDYGIGSSSTDGPALVVSGAPAFAYIGCGWGHCELKPNTIKSAGTVQIVNFTAGLDANRTPGSAVLADQTMATVHVFLDTSLAVNLKYDHTASGLAAIDVQGAVDELAPGDWAAWTVGSPWANEATLFMAPVPVLSAQVQSQAGSAIAQIEGVVVIAGADLVTALTGGSGVATLPAAAPVGQRPASPQPVNALVQVYWASFAQNIYVPVSASISTAGNVNIAFPSCLSDGATDLLTWLGTVNAGGPADFAAVFFTGTYPLV